MKKREIDFYLLQLVWLTSYLVFVLLELNSWYMAILPTILMVVIVFFAAFVIFVKSIKKRKK